MNRPLSNVVDINPMLRRPWTVLMQVLERGHRHQSQAGNDFKRIVMSDTQGTKLTALIYSNNLRYFANTLIPYRRYYISSAVVIPNDTRFRLGPYLYSWILNNRTLVEELVEPIPTTLPCTFEFTKFSDLHKHADSDNLQNVRAIVLKCLPTMDHDPDTVTRRDIVIADEEKKLLLLTLWNDFEENEGTRLANMVDAKPMVFGMKLKVTTFNCLSLTTRGPSGIMINPPVTEDLQMHNWYNNNHSEVQLLVESESYKDHNLLLPYPQPEDIVPVAMANTSLTKPGSTWVQGKMKLSLNQRGYWFTACANCKKSLDADPTWVVTCPSCKVESEVEPLSRLVIDITDETGSIQTTMCSPDVELFLLFTVVQLKESEETGLDVHDDISTSIEMQTIIAFVRSYEMTIRGQGEMKFSIVKAYKAVESQSAIASSVDSTSQEVVPKVTPAPTSTPISLKKQGTTNIIREGPSKKNKHHAP